MRVSLLTCTPDPLRVIYTAYRQCCSTTSAEVLYGTPLPPNARRFVQSCIDAGHTSPLEHVAFTFAVSGVSRALSHQLVRHRIASYSQKSQRYTPSDVFVIPAAIEKHENRMVKDVFDHALNTAWSAYQQLLEMGVPREDARSILPNASETSIVVTMNARALLNFFELRLCERAQEEIRELAELMRDLCRKELPVVFDEVGPRCVRLGYCPERAGTGCGRYPGK